MSCLVDVLSRIALLHQRFQLGRGMRTASFGVLTSGDILKGGDGGITLPWSSRMGWPKFQGNPPVATIHHNIIGGVDSPDNATERGKLSKGYKSSESAFWMEKYCNASARVRRAAGSAGDDFRLLRISSERRFKYIAAGGLCHKAQPRSAGCPNRRQPALIGFRLTVRCFGFRFQQVDAVGQGVAQQVAMQPGRRCTCASNTGVLGRIPSRTMITDQAWQHEQPGQQEKTRRRYSASTRGCPLHRQSRRRSAKEASSPGDRYDS